MTLQVSYENVKFAASDRHLGNPLSEAVIGRIFWAKNNWQWIFRAKNNWQL